MDPCSGEYEVVKRLKGTISTFGSEPFHMPTVVFGTCKPERVSIKMCSPRQKKPLNSSYPKSFKKTGRDKIKVFVRYDKLYIKNKCSGAEIVRFTFYCSLTISVFILLCAQDHLLTYCT